MFISTASDVTYWPPPCDTSCRRFSKAAPAKRLIFSLCSTIPSRENIESGLVLEKNLTIVSTVALVVLQADVIIAELTTAKLKIKLLTIDQFIATSFRLHELPEAYHA